MHAAPLEAAHASTEPTVLPEITSKHRVLLIRHAESEYNRGMLQVGGAKALVSLEAEPAEVKFDAKYLDCSITDRGTEQCAHARDQLRDVNVKIVIVSPLRRALETCNLIFKDHPSKPRVVVLPIFREMLLSSCDIGSRIEESMRDFPTYDFSALAEVAAPKVWVLDYIYNDALREATADKVRDLCAQWGKDVNDADGGPLAIMEAQKAVFPTPFEVQKDGNVALPAQRTAVRNLLAELGENEKLAVVAHSRVLKTFAAERFDENGEPVASVFLRNCEVHAMEM